jgi:hypothetical protein
MPAADRFGYGRRVGAEQTSTAESIYRGVAGFALLIGIGALLFPRTLLRIYGVDASELSGAGALGWRLFAVRHLVVAGAALSGHRQARDVVLAVQLPDIAIFAHCYATRSIPRRTSILALASAGSVALLSAIARTRD